MVPLLTTKLYIPPTRSDLVSRPRLVRRLQAALQHGQRLTLVSAPAGFGKTTLLTEWLHPTDKKPSRLPAGWLSLDDGDNDPARFLAYLIAALQTIRADIGQSALASLQSPQPPPAEAILTGLINDLAREQEANPGPGPVLVLDDYHLITTQPVHRIVSFLLEHAPPPPSGLHLVVATRTDPDLPLARLRGRGQLTELRVSDLRFTPDETAALLNEIAGLGLSAQDVLALEQRTEGWITGLQLAALSMQGRDEKIHAFVQDFTGSHRFVLDYLVEEVLQRQPEPDQAFLLKTAILDRLTGPLCEAVTCQKNGQATLARLDRSNLFIIPLDDERRWYRYHRLFADLLCARLNQVYPGEASTLHRRASLWYAGQALFPEAIDHALTAKDFERAGDLIEQSAWTALTRGEMTTLRGWLEALPDKILRTQPQLRIFQAWALTLAGRPAAAEGPLREAERFLKETDSAETSALLGQAAALRGYIARLQGDALQAIELSRHALKNLPEEDRFLRGVVALNLATAYWYDGDAAQAAEAAARSAHLSQSAGNTTLALIAISILGQAQEMQGRLCEAAATYRQALELASDAKGEPAPFAGLAYAGLAGPLLEWNDLDGAVCHAQKAIELGQRGGSLETIWAGSTTLAAALQAQGNFDGAQAIIEDQIRLAQEHNLPHVAANASIQQAQLWLAQGNVTAASRWADESGLSIDGEISFFYQIGYITLARVLVAQGRYGEALTLLARLREAAAARGQVGTEITLLALQALAFHGQGDERQAIARLEQALSLAEPEGYVRALVDAGQPMADLLSAFSVRRSAISREYIDNLLAVLRADEKSAFRPSSLVESLSERELEVLALVAAGMSNKEIAEDLVITVGTVKSHLNHAYGKLGVQNRTQAVNKAKDLRLL